MLFFVYLLVGLSLNLIKFAEIHAPELFDGIKEDLEEHRRQDKHVGAQGFKIHIQVSRIFSYLFDFKMYLTRSPKLTEIPKSVQIQSKSKAQKLIILSSREHLENPRIAH